MKKIIFLFILILSSYNFVFSQSLTCDYLIELGKEALKEQDYQEARFYFLLAKKLCPFRKELNLFLDALSKTREQKKKETKTELTSTTQVQKSNIDLEERKKKIIKALDLWEKKILKKTKKPRLKKITKSIQKKQKKKRKKEKIRILYLTDELFKTQPKTSLKIEINKSLIIEGKNILRYLVETPPVITVERIDLDRIKITGKEIGSTFFHLWEEKRRWTFYIKVIPLYIRPPSKEIFVYEETPFKITYTGNWQSYYKGAHIKDLERTSLLSTHGINLVGPTPYGNFDSSLVVNRADKKTEVSGYSVGITQGKIGNIKDFTLRGFDFFARLSDLSLPGETLRGVFWQVPVSNKKLNYTILWGKEREGVYGFLAPGILAERKTYLGGLRFSFFPSKTQSYSFNFAHRYGKETQSYLKERVYSMEGRINKGNKGINWELSFDEDCFAGILNTNFRFSNLDFGISIRNIEKDFVTISGYPGNRGEKGIIFRINWTPQKNLNLNSNLDIYKTKYLYNLSEPKKVNINWNSSLLLRPNSSSNLFLSLNYSNEPQLSFPRRYLNFNTTYSFNFELFKRKILPFLGIGFSRSTNPLSPSSNYNRINVRGGIRVPLTKNIFYRVSYEQIWVEERFTNKKSSPSVLETGIDLRKNITSDLSLDLNLSYRDEEDAISTYSFLTGEDSLESSLRFTYTPFKNTEFFIEGNLRNAWKENPGVQSYREADLRWGIRSCWDTFFRWNPKGRICGIVFKDDNGNGEKEKDEMPLKGVKIKIGKKIVSTDEQGCFCTTVRAKKVIVKIDSQSLPEGFILTTPSSYKIDISSCKKSFVVFGASVFSSIYGIVFFDENSNGKFDRGEKPFPHVKITLGKKTAFTNLEGCYYFKHLKEGVYTLKLDINSLPLEYLPCVPLEKKIVLSKGVNYFYPFPLRKKENE